MTLRAPLRFLRIKSIAITGGQPLFTRARATSSGARPSPATQCTPIRPSLLWPVCLGFSEVTATSYLLSSMIPVFSMVLVSRGFCSLFWSLWSKKSVTMLNHLLITVWLGNIPSGKISSYTRHWFYEWGYFNIDVIFPQFFFIISFVATS